MVPPPVSTLLPIRPLGVVACPGAAQVAVPVGVVVAIHVARLVVVSTTTEPVPTILHGLSVRSASRSGTRPLRDGTGLMRTSFLSSVLQQLRPPRMAPTTTGTPTPEPLTTLLVN
jgi:hypothetical protein